MLSEKLIPEMHHHVQSGGSETHNTNANTDPEIGAEMSPGPQRNFLPQSSKKATQQNLASYSELGFLAFGETGRAVVRMFFPAAVESIAPCSAELAL